MSFATGLFSFLGGASQQFRDEIDLANSYKIQQASLKAEQEKKLADFLFEQQKHNDNMKLQQDQFKLQQDKFEHDKYVFGLEHGLELDKLGFTRAKWADEYKILVKDHDLKIQKLNNDIQKTTDSFQLGILQNEMKQAELDFDKSVQQFKETNSISELDWQKEKFYAEMDLEYEKLLTNQKKGVVNYGSNLSFNFKDYSDSNTRHRTFLSYLNTNLTKEIIDDMPLEDKQRLQTDINANFSLLLDSIAMTGEANEGKYRDIFGMYNIDNLVDMSNYLGVNLKQTLKEHAASDLNVDSNDVLVESQVVDDGEGNTETVISTRVFDEKEYLKKSQFESIEQFNTAVSSLVQVNNKVAKNNKFFGSMVNNMSAFEDNQTLISSMETAGIDFRVLQLYDHFNAIQESSHDRITLATNYNQLAQDAFDIGLLQIDKAGNIQGEEHLVKFLHLVQPEAEFPMYVPGSSFVAGSNNPSAYGRDKDFVIKDYVLQNSSARQAIQTTDMLMNVVFQNKGSDKLLGLSLNAAAAYYGGTEQFKTLASFFGGTNNSFGTSLNIVNEDNNVATEAIQKYSNQILEAGKIISDETGIFDVAAKKKAKLTLLKFTLAYQVSMALQGGSGGRTISDQDVENILKGLSLSDDFFSFDTPDKTMESLFTLREFLEGIELKTRFIATGNTMKNIRTHDATQQLLSAIAANGGVESSANGFLKAQEERHNVNLDAGDDIAKVFIPTMYQNNNGWDVRRASNGTPIYVELKNGVYVRGSAKYIPNDIYSQMIEEIDGLSADDFVIQPYNKEKPPEYAGAAVTRILGQ